VPYLTCKTPAAREPPGETGRPRLRLGWRTRRSYACGSAA
jgi:hypothetical protein